MHENLGAAAGMAGLAALAFRVVQGILHLCDLVDDLRDAPREAAGLTMELKSLQAVLESIGPLAHTAVCDDADLRRELTALERAVQLCDAEVKTIQAFVLAVRHASQRGHGIARWLKRLLDRLRMVLQKLKLHRRIRALEQREMAIRLTAITRQVQAPSAIPSISSAPSTPSTPSTTRELALRPSPVSGPAPTTAQSRAQTLAPILTQPAARASSAALEPAAVRPTTVRAPSPQPYAHMHRLVEVIEPLDAAEYGACTGLCQGTELLRSYRMGMPRSSWSVREIVEIRDEKEGSPRQEYLFPSVDAAGQRPHTPLRPSTPSSLPPLTRSPTCASCDSFATVQSDDQVSNDPASPCQSQTSSISDPGSPDEPATPRFLPHWSSRSTKHHGVSLTKHHRDSIRRHLTSYSEIVLMRHPEPYQGRDSDDEDLDYV